MTAHYLITKKPILCELFLKKVLNLKTLDMFIKSFKSC